MLRWQRQSLITSSGTQTSPVTIIDNSKEKAPEQPSQKHSPRKDNKKIIVKPKTTLKKKPGKNVSLKIAREANSSMNQLPSLKDFGDGKLSNHGCHGHRR
ncbi:hypothetical protein TNCV_1644821 [Trichonephila clavipes]|nr:hypothetical protein TNCV_1644821 [Trichonephila clavipes]